MTISESAMDKLMRKAGAERVSDSAKRTLKLELEKKAVEIGKRALMFSKHAGRKTIKSSDVEMALKGEK